MTALTTIVYDDLTTGSTTSRTLSPSRSSDSATGVPVLNWFTENGNTSCRTVEMRNTCDAWIGPPTKGGVRRCIINIAIPVPEQASSSGDVEGYVAAPKAAHIPRAKVEFFLPNRSTLNDRISLNNLVQAAVIQANIVDLVESMVQPV